MKGAIGMTTATKITFLRVVLIPVFIILMMMGDGAWRIAALIVFITASVTDFIDGYIARHYNQVSDMGKFLDPLADKLLVLAALIMFVEFGQTPAWAVIIIIARELAISGLRMIAASKGLVIAAAWSGKIKTASSLVAICFMFPSFHDYVLFAGVTIDAVCTFVMVVTTVISGVEYFVKNGHILLDKSAA